MGPLFSWTLCSSVIS